MPSPAKLVGWSDNKRKSCQLSDTDKQGQRSLQQEPLASETSQTQRSLPAALWYTPKVLLPLEAESRLGDQRTITRYKTTFQV